MVVVPGTLVVYRKLEEDMDSDGDQYHQAMVAGADNNTGGSHIFDHMDHNKVGNVLEANILAGHAMEEVYVVGILVHTLTGHNAYEVEYVRTVLDAGTLDLC